MFESALFYFFSALVIGCFAIAITSKNILHAISALACGMVFLSAHYFMLDAEFLGAAQIIVYSGAVLGLYSFAIMFFDLSRDLRERLNHKKTFFLLSVSASLILVFMALGLRFYDAHVKLPVFEGLQNTQNIGIILFTKYLLAFEIVALVLLIATIAAISLISKKLKEE